MTRLQLLMVGLITTIIVCIFSLQDGQNVWITPHVNAQIASSPTFSCNDVSEIDLTECQALVKLYETTGGSGWIHQAGWLTTNIPCSWHGIDCLDGGVIDIDLPANNLIGTLPNIFNQFTRLQRVGFHSNNLTGGLPPSLFTLPSLTIIRIDANRLSGPIPTDLAQLPNLVSLNLAQNDFSGVIPPELGTINSMERLILSDNNLTGTIPTTLMNLTKLTKLYLFANQLSGPLPATIGNLVNLQELLVRNNQLSGEIPAALVNLQRLTPVAASTSFNYNMLTSTNSSVIAFLAAKSPDWVTTQTVPPTNLLAQSASTTAIALSWSPIPYTGDGGYYEISYATAAGGPFMIHGVTPDKYSSSYTLSGLTPATTYYLRVRTYTPPHDVQVAALFSSYTPTISTTTGTNTAFACANVTGISTTECEALVSFYNSTNGVQWRTRTNWLTTNTPCSWYGVECLNNAVSQLLMNSNLLAGSLPAEISNLNQLIVLRVDDNNLSGFVPPALGQLSRLERLNLSQNNFRGTIPTTLGNLSNLLNLSFADNLMSGQIPPELQQLASLQKLHLAENTFSGNFPAALCNLTTLQELTVDRNQLGGELPSCLPQLSLLINGDGLTDFGYNMFTASSTALRAFLNSHDPDWEQTQTVPPNQLVLTAISLNQIMINWTPVLYRTNDGYYEISVATEPNGAYAVKGEISDKNVASFVINGLEAGTTYYIRGRTITRPHDTQQNYLFSPYTAVLTAQTDRQPTPTFTVTPTATPTHTPTPTPTITPTNIFGTACTPGTQGANCGTNYLPIVNFGFATPTIEPLPTTPPTPTAAWQRFEQLAGDVNVITTSGSALYVGKRATEGNGSEGNGSEGLYQALGCGLNASFNKLVANRDVRDLAFAATAGIAAINDGKLFYSSNGGGNWQQTSSDINPFFYAVQFVNNQQAYAGANDGVYLSNDSGVTWSKIMPQNGLGPLLINAMYYDGNTLWIGTNDSGIWQIAPNSANFQQRNDGLIANTEEELVIWDILAVSPTEIYLATDTGVFRGNTQTAWRSFGLERVPVLSLAVANDLIYAGTKANGLRYRRLDASTDWALIADPKVGNAPIRDLHYDQSTLCRDPVTGRNALLVGTKDGIWVYR